MTIEPLILADDRRVQAFGLLGSARRPWQNRVTWIDDQGIPWTGVRIGDHGFGATWLGSGWVFDPYAALQRADDRQRRLTAVTAADQDLHQCEFQQLVSRLHFGRLGERLLWGIHAAVLRARSSVVCVPDLYLGQAAWGRSRQSWPTHWRTDVLKILTGLSWLHVQEWRGSTRPDFGTESALLTHVGDLKGTEDDVCDEGCAQQGRPHRHIVVNIGRGFLGDLEQFAGPDDGTGVRTYGFQVDATKRATAALRRIGKQGHVVSMFLPAKLGDPAVCKTFTTAQHRLFQSIVRETTRATRQHRRDSSATDIVTGNAVIDPGGKKTLVCPLLDPNGQYAGFNGNKRRKGQGYRLCTPGGWLAKAGYDSADIKSFLADLAALAMPLGLIVAGLSLQTRQWLNLETLQALAATPIGFMPLRGIHLRVYTADDYLDQWSSFFMPHEDIQTALAPADRIGRLALNLVRRRITRRSVATAIGADPSFLGKAMAGKKPFPANMLEAAESWVAGQIASRQARPLMPGLDMSIPTDQGTLLRVAMEYLQASWSVVPQMAGAKHPLIQWKPFQQQRPTQEELRQWFNQWQDAGLAVVLGAVSDLFVIDVDGPDAHAVLIERLGAEPETVKAITGSGQPCRYHLFFRHPEIPTRAKATPWHPKLEFRGERGIVVIPPSLHRSGNRYRWAEDRSPADKPMLDVPAEIFAALSESSHRQPASPAQPIELIHLPSEIQVSASTRLFLEGQYANGPGWNEKLFRAACDLNGHGLPPHQAEPLLLAGARPWDETERETAQRTIQSAYSQQRIPART